VHGLFKSGRSVALIAVLALAGAGIAYGAIPDANGVIHACVTKNTRYVRVISATAKCGTGEVALSWNEQGSLGDPGKDGAPGPKGATGAKGPKGDTGPSGITAASGSYAGHVPSPLPTTAQYGIAPAGPMAHITLSPGDKVLVTVSGVFGTTNTLGATGLYVGICLRNVNAWGDDGLRWANQESLDTYTGYGSGFAADNGKPLLVNLTTVEDGLTGPTDAGLCYSTTNANWDHNGSLWTTAVALHS
jgi:hypothetical protein